MNERPIFVVGSPRSGTHLLRFCLGRHERLYICPETRFFSRIYGNRHLFARRGIRAHARRIVDIVFESGDPTMAEFDHLKPSLTAAIETRADSYSDVAGIVFGTFARDKGKPRWGEKTPLHVLYIPAIRRLFPGARIICMHRNAPNVVASYLASSHLPRDFHKGLATWLVCEHAARRFDGDDVCHVSYETLTHGPRSELERICAFIGERYDPAMLSPGMRDSAYGDDVMELDQNIGITPEDEEKWRRVLDTRQAKLVQRLAAEGRWWPGTDGLVDMARVWRSRASMGLYTLRARAGFEGLRRLLTAGSP